MGKVFTWAQLSNRAVPTAENFSAVINLLKDSLPHQQAIPVALICGSAIRGDHNVRSDIDCVVVYDHRSRRIARAHLQHLVKVAVTQHKVPLTFVPCDSKTIMTRMHHYGPTFVKHLKRSATAGGLIKGDLFGLIEKSPSVSAVDELESYLRVKYYNLQESWVEYPAHLYNEELRVKTLKKMLEAPVHVARKTLQLFGDLDGDSKSAICKQYREWAPDLAKKLDDLVALDAEYTAEVARQLEKRDNVAYTEFLSYLDEEAHSILDFVQANVELAASIDRTIKVQPLG